MNNSARNAALSKCANNGWLPWWMHGRDTAGIMVLLVDNWLSKAAVHETGIDPVILKKTAAFLGYLHDMGKLISIFQCLITETLPDFRQILNENKLWILGKKDYLYPGKTPHAYAGQWILSDPCMQQRPDRSVISIIGAHHGRPMDLRDVNDKTILEVYARNFFGTVNSREAWIHLWNEELEEGLNIAGFSGAGEIPALSVQTQVLLAGLLVTAVSQITFTTTLLRKVLS